MAVLKLYVEKKKAFAVEAASVLADLKTALQVESVTGVRIVNRYLAEGLAQEDFDASVNTIFSEPQVDNALCELPELPGKVFAVEFLPGQFDQRADSCAQCISLATGKARPTIQTAKLYSLEGDISDAEFERIKKYLINPVESREASLSIPETLQLKHEIPTTVETLTGFTTMDAAGRDSLHKQLGLAMDLADLLFCQEYFARDEKRDPTITELKMIDTYWSDHCRHTTFLTEIDSIETDWPELECAKKRYFELRDKLYGDKHRPVTLMDMATIGARALKRQGMLPDLDESEEINACSVKIKVDVDGEEQDWLLMFKNETHTHPTEIEPFGGAATCLGGAIRDPLSGRSYVYQAMRVTGSGNPLQSVEETLPSKLPQRKIAQTAAAGYSSYGNQIGLATGHVHEIYHPGYTAKHMEIGAVIGAAPAENVRRERPAPGDVVLLIGGRTGRDGCGGATGSSKSHSLESLETCGAEVQKGNPPEERKLQRLFRNPEAARLIKRCNDFGAGGVSVSIGELADGLIIDLDKVLKKYEGLDGTELAISESQERMSIVLDAADVKRFIELSDSENLESTEVAVVTEAARLVLNWNGNAIVNLSRDFLNSNGAAKNTTMYIPQPKPFVICDKAATGADIIELQKSLAACSQKGLVERFDSTIGAGSVLMPFGGLHQLTPAQSMAAKIPVMQGQTNTTSLMSWGFDPLVSEQSPYHGGAYAVVESVAKLIATGGTRKKMWLTFQEYFERTNDDPQRWGKPAAALLGALEAQLELGIAAIGGKDSMSGSFEQLDVPPTLVSFAVSVADASAIISNEFKTTDGGYLYLVAPDYRYNSPLPEMDSLRKTFDLIECLISRGKLTSAWALGAGGTAKAIPQMCFGNRIGFTASTAITSNPMVGAFLVGSPTPIPELEGKLIGRTCEEYKLTLKSSEVIELADIEAAWLSTLEPVFPLNTAMQSATGAEPITFTATSQKAPAIKVARPRVAIPTFPGTNCEDDTARAFARAGADPTVFVIRNRTPDDIAASVKEFAEIIRQSQIIAIPGGFSGGDEPDGSAKFITAFFRNANIKEAVREHLNNRDGLMLGICNGFQALVKLGLLPYGDILDMDEACPTLTYNSIGRHQSMLARTRVSSNLSPWLSSCSTGEIYTVAISHGEGRFIAPDSVLDKLEAAGQIATQYVDMNGMASQDIRYNPNNAMRAIEGITSPDGRILGKMGHNERYGDNLYRNVPGRLFMDIFSGAVNYWK